MLEYPHSAVHLLEAPLLGDQEDLRTFLHLLDAALNSWNGRPGDSFLQRFACLNWDPNRSAIGQDPWQHLAFFSVFVRSSVDPLSLDLRHHKGASYEIMEKTSVGSPRHLLSK